MCSLATYGAKLDYGRSALNQPTGGLGIRGPNYDIHSRPDRTSTEHADWLRGVPRLFWKVVARDGIGLQCALYNL
jgi:hypothetical protein